MAALTSEDALGQEKALPREAGPSGRGRPQNGLLLPFPLRSFPASKAAGTAGDGATGRERPFLGSSRTEGRGARAGSEASSLPAHLRLRVPMTVAWSVWWDATTSCLGPPGRGGDPRPRPQDSPTPCFSTSSSSCSSSLGLQRPFFRLKCSLRRYLEATRTRVFWAGMACPGRQWATNQSPVPAPQVNRSPVPAPQVNWSPVPAPQVNRSPVPTPQVNWTLSERKLVGFPVGKGKDGPRRRVCKPSAREEAWSGVYNGLSAPVTRQVAQRTRAGPRALPQGRQRTGRSQGGRGKGHSPAGHTAPQTPHENSRACWRGHGDWAPHAAGTERGQPMEGRLVGPRGSWHPQAQVCLRNKDAKCSTSLTASLSQAPAHGAQHVPTRFSGNTLPPRHCPLSSHPPCPGHSGVPRPDATNTRVPLPDAGSEACPRLDPVDGAAVSSVQTSV